MKKLPLLLRWAITLSTCLCLSIPVYSQTCSVTATSLAFGTYNPMSGLESDSSANISVVCQAVASLLVSYSVKLSSGSSGSIAARKMITSGSQLSYQIYTDAAHTVIWGDGTSGSSYNTGSYLLSVLVPVTNTYTAYGRIPALQNVYAGVYTDTLTVLVAY